MSAVKKYPDLKFPKTTMTDSELNEKLVRARVNLLLNAPFYGIAASRLNLIDATKWCKTAATDGINLYYNRDFLAVISEANTLFLVAHEVEHCVYEHVLKEVVGDRDQDLSNKAQDFVINLDLSEANIGKPIDCFDICLDPVFTGMNWYEVYDLLSKNSKKLKLRIDPKHCHTLDEHMPGGCSGTNPKQGQGKSAPSDEGSENNDGSDGPIVYTPDELEAHLGELRNTVLDAFRIAEASKQAGRVPGGLKLKLSRLTDPVLDWRELLPQKIKSTIKNDYTFLRPSRRGQDSGIFFPGMNHEYTVRVAAAIDTSGSVSDDMVKDFLTEVYGIMTEFVEFELWLWSFDTQTYNPVKFTQCNAHEIHEYQLHGRGGTLFECNWKLMKEMDLTPDVFVMFTDGYPCDTWGDPNWCDTIFITHGKTAPIGPFGVTVQYSRKTDAR